MYTYQITNKEISISDLSGKSIIIQKGYPNGELFDTDQEATDWAESYLAMVNGTSNFYPKEGKNIDPKPLKTLEDYIDNI